MRKQNKNYFSYMLRAWRDSDGAEWRFSLERVFGKGRIQFRDFASLVRYLQDVLRKGGQGKGNGDNDQPNFEN